MRYIYKKIAMLAGDDEQIINYEWPNLPFATVGHESPLFKSKFPDSNIAKSYSCCKSKASCILKYAIVPDLQAALIDQMKCSCFSITIDWSND